VQYKGMSLGDSIDDFSLLEIVREISVLYIKFCSILNKQV